MQSSKAYNDWGKKRKEKKREEGRVSEQGFEHCGSIEKKTMHACVGCSDKSIIGLQQHALFYNYYTDMQIEQENNY